MEWIFSTLLEILVSLLHIYHSNVHGDTPTIKKPPFHGTLPRPNKALPICGTNKVFRAVWAKCYEIAVFAIFLDIEKWAAM